jgi:hypothetical protein
MNALKFALEIGLGCAQEVANRTHAEYKGYKPHRHASVDADVKTIEDALAAIAVAEIELPQEHEVWRCFHCDEVFADRESAALHFGASLVQQPACQIDMAEYRVMEETNRLHCEEDTDLHREIHRLHVVHRTALQREEENGYAKGLRDALQAADKAKTYIAVVEPHHDRLVMDNRYYSIERVRSALAAHPKAPQAAAPEISMLTLDAAFEEAIQSVSEVEYNSNKICRWFYDHLRKCLASGAPAIPPLTQFYIDDAQPKQECRHCGFLCAVNPDEKKKWYPLEKSAQPISLPAAKGAVELTDEQIGNLEYMGNSVSWWHMKAKAYGDACVRHATQLQEPKP